MKFIYLIYSHLLFLWFETNSKKNTQKKKPLIVRSLRYKNIKENGRNIIAVYP